MSVQVQEKPIEIESRTVEPAVSNLKIKRSELIMFTTQLSVMLESGVVLSDALEAIAEQDNQDVFRFIVMDIAERIAVLDFGVKIGEGSPREVAEHPEIIKAYLGEEV